MGCICETAGTYGIALITKYGSTSYIGIDMVPSIIDVWGYDREFSSISSSSSSSTRVTQKQKYIN